MSADLPKPVQRNIIFSPTDEIPTTVISCNAMEIGYKFMFTKGQSEHGAYFYHCNNVDCKPLRGVDDVLF